jgi:hypothetical protein
MAVGRILNASYACEKTDNITFRVTNPSSQSSPSQPPRRQARARAPVLGPGFGARPGWAPRSNASRSRGEIAAQVLNPTQPMNELIRRALSKTGDSLA